MDPLRPIVQIRLTRAAVDRLLGEDPDLELKLQQQIIEHVVKTRFIKQLENSETMRQTFRRLEMELAAEMVKRVGTVVNNGYGAVATGRINDEIRVKIVEEARRLINDEMVKQMIDAAVLHNMNAIQTRVMARVGEIVAEETDKVIRPMIAGEIAKAASKVASRLTA